MRAPGVPSLNQLGVFLAVVETGSFAAAGRRLGRATSAVSYAIANLEQQLGVQLFDRDQARKPALTEAGAAVLSEARSISVGVDNLRAKVKGLLDGLEAEITLAVDVMLPTARLVDAMRAFEATFPTVTLRLYVEALGAVTQLVHSGIADIGISGVDATLPGIERIKVGGVELIPVAAPSHPLARSREYTRRCAELCATRAHRSLHTDRRSRFFGYRCQDMAPRGFGFQVCVAAGGYRLGQHARADGPCGSCGGALETARTGGMVRGFLCLACNSPDRYSAGACRRLAGSTLFPSVR